MPSTYDLQATALIRTMCEGRDTRALSTALGAKTDVVARWTRGRRMPRADEALRLSTLTGGDPHAAFEVLARPLETLTQDRVEGAVQALLRTGDLGALSTRLGRSRAALGRLVRGDARVRLPDLLAVVDGTTDRLDAFLAALGATSEAPTTSVWSRYPFLDAVRLVSDDERDGLARALGVPRAEVDAAHAALTDELPTGGSASAAFWASHMVGVARSLGGAANMLVFGVDADTLADIATTLAHGIPAAMQAAHGSKGGRLALVRVHLTLVDPHTVPPVPGDLAAPPPAPARPTALSIQRSYDYDTLASELVRAVRGRQSQGALSKRLGFRSNVVWRWENGRSTPYAHDILRLLHLQGHDVVGALRLFDAPAGLRVLDLSPEDPALVTEYVSALLEQARIAAMAEREGLSRSALGRLARGERPARLPEFLMVLHAANRFLLDLVARFVDPAELPSVAERWAYVQRRRRLGQSFPFYSELLMALHHPTYLGTPHDVDFLARTVDQPAERVQAALEAHADAGLLRWDGERYASVPTYATNHGVDPEWHRMWWTHWATLAERRLAQGRSMHRHLVLRIADRDAPDVWHVLSHQLRALIPHFEKAGDVERIGCATAELVALDGGPLFDVGRR
jgi:transcriptional regulator with XRE-family HTH domain